jgi:hypothetical protein
MDVVIVERSLVEKIEQVEVLVEGFSRMIFFQM